MVENEMIVDEKKGILTSGNTTFKCVHTFEDGIMVNWDHTELRFVQKYFYDNKEAMDIDKISLVLELCKKEMDVTMVDECVDELIDQIRRDDRLDCFVYPFCECVNIAEDGFAKYTISELPERFDSEYFMISDIIENRKFSMKARMRVASVLVEAFAAFEQLLGNTFQYIGPDVIYVNIQTGDVRVFVEKMMQKDVCSKCDRVNYMHMVLSEDEQKQEKQIARFLVYTIFRLMCGANPFDGSQTLVNYPYLSKNAIDFIHSGACEFIYNSEVNSFSEYIGDVQFAMWKSLPRFARTFFKSEFQCHKGLEELVGIKEVLYLVRRLKDCMVSVKGKNRFCDPEGKKNKVLFLTTDDYQVPIWPGKKIYWYHIFKEYEMQRENVMLAIKEKDYLENVSNQKWAVECDKTTTFIQPGNRVAVECGMDITIGSTTISVTQLNQDS